MTLLTTSETMIREDLSGYLSIISTAETPLHRFLGRETVTQKVHEYGIDGFNFTRTIASIASNAKAEGATFSTTDDAVPNRLRSIAQINWKGVAVSGTNRASQHAGISDPFEFRVYKAMVDTANNQEMALLWGTGGTAAASPRLTQGLVHWAAFTGLARTLGSAATTLADTNSNTINDEFFSNFYNAGGVNLDLSMLTDKILGGAVDQGFQVQGSVAMCGRKLKALISNFALGVNGPLNYRQIPAYDNYITENVQFIETASFGTLPIAYNRYFDLPGQSMSVDNVSGQGTSGLFNSSFPCNETMVVFMPEYVKVGTLRGLGWAPLPYTLDGDQGVVLGEEMLIVRNPLAVTGGCNLLAAA